MIREIRKNIPMGQQKLRIVDNEGKFFISVTEKESEGRYNSNYEHIHIEVTKKRLEQLANDILTHLNKKAKWEEWTPTFDDLERKLKERYTTDEFYMWIIDWLRKPWNEKVAKRIYEWLKTGEELGMFHNV